ncbi:biotin--protein ligase-like isoform X2 [Homarus americanus]|uniref:biotin--protein ligase-like isoform X2 n=1 Tax=Homarus americanus TaxID=6706 RepID=UPI001C44122D|nr:biotin--protein ligase-like isoform X2 [Homarus americanus]
MAFKSPWTGSTTLLVVCGDVPAHVSTVFIRYLLQGGRVLSVCSDFLNMAVPLFGTVEVQEQAVVTISYRRWSSVQLLHHQHCFHSSPQHKRFSRELENTKDTDIRSAVSVEPTHVEIVDEYGGRHRLDLKILATDDTWGAPSLLSARVHQGKGSAVFSQVHLERDPRECFTMAGITSKLSISNEARLEILRDLLSTELCLDTNMSTSATSYSPAYFLGRHELKQTLINKLRPHMEKQELRRSQLTIQFVTSGMTARQPDDDVLPLLMSACPLTFSTVKYFEALKTSAIGRLVIYCDVMTSSMKVTAGHPPLVHGIVVLPTQQTQGKGRSGNSWLSPLGCAMFTTQLHIALSSNLGQHLTFLQHLIAIAVVQAVREHPGYADIPIHLKWPNDIYVGTNIKIGGVIVEATTIGSEIIANVGCGVNLSNSNPTYCINDAVRQHNKEYKSSLCELDRETFLARVFNSIEELIETFQAKGPGAVQHIYYKYWLHSNATVTVQNEHRRTESAVIIGVDNYGFLEAQLVSGTIITLQPDGNSFNMMDGLIYSKLH